MVNWVECMRTAVGLLMTMAVGSSADSVIEAVSNFCRLTHGKQEDDEETMVDEMQAVDGNHRRRHHDYLVQGKLRSAQRRETLAKEARIEKEAQQGTPKDMSRLAVLLHLFIVTTPKAVDGPEGEDHLETTVDPSNFIAKRYNKKKHQLGITLKEQDGEVVVRTVVKNSPTQNAGLHLHDVLIKVDDKPAMLDSARQSLAAALETNSAIKIVFKRPGKTVKGKARPAFIPKKPETARDELAQMRTKAAEAQRKVRERAAEDDEKRTRRLQKNAQRMAQLRDSQTPKEREQEQEATARRVAELRASQTPKEREQEQEAAARGMAELRARQTPKEREQEQEAAARGMAELRARQTPKEREQEQEATARRVAELRASQTPKEREQELEAAARGMAELRARQTPKEREEEQEAAARGMAELRASRTPLERQQEQEADARRKAERRENETEEEYELRLLKDRTKKRFDKAESKEEQRHRLKIEELMEKYPSLKEQKELYEYISFRKRVEGQSIKENFDRIQELKQELFRKQLDESPAESVKRLEFYDLLDKYWVQRKQYAPQEDVESGEFELDDDELEAEEEATRRMKDTAARLKGMLQMQEHRYWNRKDIRRIKRRYMQPRQPEPTPERKKEEEELMEQMFELAIAVSFVSCVNCEEWKRMSAGGYAQDSQAVKFTDKCLEAYQKMINDIDPSRYQSEENRKDAELRKKWMNIAVQELRKEKAAHEEAMDRDSAKGDLHICRYCNGKLREGRVPPISFYNDMRPDKVPVELEAINDLGETLIALQTPFLKLLSLPAGGQHALDGQVTNVPNDWNSVKAALRIPRNWDEATLVGVAMKRRTEYKSDYLAMYIDPEALWKAAVWLSKNNPEYAGLNLNPNWAKDFRSQQPQLAEAMILPPGEEPRPRPAKPSPRVTEVNIGTPPVPSRAQDERTPTKEGTKEAQTQPTGPSTPRNFAVRLSRSLSRMSITPRKSPQVEKQPPYSPMYTEASPKSPTSVHMQSPTASVAEDRMSVQLVTPAKPRSSSTPSSASKSPGGLKASELAESRDVYEMDGDNLLVPMRGLELPPTKVVEERRGRGVLSQGQGQVSQPSRVVVAPAENNTPIPFFTNEKAEEHSFPTLFPKGRFGFCWNRELQISYVQYARNRLKHSSNQFSSHKTYLFWAAYAYEIRRLESSISIQMRKGQAKGKDGGRRVNAGALLDQDTMDKYMANAGAFQVLAPMRGSPQYWNSATQDLVSMIRQLGPCTFFLTLSANDRNWKDVLTILLRKELQREPSQKEVANLSNRDRDDLVRKYKVEVAQQFYHRVQMAWKHVLRTHFQPLGEIVDFWQRYEIQARGSIHLHCLLWVKEAPTLGVETDDEICQFIDKYITTEIPDADRDPALYNHVTTLLQHGHRPSCQKRKLKPEHKAKIKTIQKDPKMSERDKEFHIKKLTEDAQCRFNYPKPITDKTYLEYEEITDGDQKVHPLTVLPAREAEWRAEAEKAGLNQAEVDARVAAKKKNFLHSLKIKVAYKRDPQSAWTNVHNTAVLRCWKANIDLQFCANMYTLIAYVSGYVSKPETEMGELLRSFQGELDVNLPTKKKLRSVGNRFVQVRKLSGQESVMKVLGLDYKRSSRKTKFLRTGPEEERWRMRKAAKELEQMDPDDDNVFIEGVFEHYQQRDCENAAVKAMSLIVFAAFYDKAVRRKKTELDFELEDMGANEVLVQEEAEHDKREDDEDVMPEDDPLDVQKMPDVINILNKAGNSIAQYRLRTRRAIIRWFRYSPDKEPEKYFLSMLQLFVPFKDEAADLNPATYSLSSNHELFQLKQADIRTAVLLTQFEFFADIIAEAFIQLEQARLNRADEDIANALAVEEGYGEEAELLQDPGALEDAFALDEEDNDNGPGEREQPFRGQPPPATTQEELTKRLAYYKAHFNEDQLGAFKDAECLIDAYISSRLSRTDYTGYNLFIHGPGGVGKSFVLEGIRLMVHEKTTHALKGSLNDSTTVVVAPTGCAALNVGGATLHSAFKIFVQQGRRRVDSISHKQIQRLQLLYADLHCIFIDEISMVSVAQLCSLHERLNTIMGTRSGEAMFGGIPIIAFGDMYQLPPVAGSYIWKEPPKSAQSSTMAVHPWKDCFRMKELKISERQKGDNTYAQLLNRVRKGEHTAADVELLMTRRLDNLGLTTDSPEIFHLPFLFPLNKEVHSHNNLRQGQLREKLAAEFGGYDGVPTLRALAVDRFANKQGKNVPVSLLDNITDDIANTGGCAKLLELMPGTRVMLRRNVNVEDGLVNGSCGTVHSWSNATTPNGLAKFLLVKFDAHKKVQVGKEQRKRLEASLLPKDPLIVPIFPIEVTFEHEGKAVLRTQFPLAINWAQTVHKAQGATLPQFVISTAGLKRTTCGLLYVALSRGPALESLYIVELDVSKIKAAGAVHDEIQRLQRFSGLTVEPGSRNRLPEIKDAAVGDYQQLSLDDQEKRQQKAATGGILAKIKSMVAPSPLELTAAQERAYEAVHSANHPPRLSASAVSIATITAGLSSHQSKIQPWLREENIPEWTATALPQLRQFCKSQAKKIWAVIEEVQKIVPRTGNGFENQYARPEAELVEKLFPAMLDLLVPVYVQGDGDCLYRAVSLSLFGTDDRRSLLRALSIFVILLLEEYFITLAKRAGWWAYSGVEFALHPEIQDLQEVCNTTREQRREMVHKTVATVWKDQTFCDLFAAHALGIVTGRPVYIYGTCRKSRRTDNVITTDTDYILNAADLVSSLTLREAFERKDPALKEANWLLSTFPQGAQQQPIMLFNTGGQGVEHFTALLRKDPIPPQSLFRPTYTVFTLDLDEYMDDRTRGAVGTPEQQLQDLALPPHFIRCRAAKRWDQPPKQQELATLSHQPSAPLLPERMPAVPSAPPGAPVVEDTPNTRRRRLGGIGSIPEEGETTPKLPRIRPQRFFDASGGAVGADSPPSWPGVASWPEWSKKHPASTSRIAPKALLNPSINAQIYIFKGDLMQPGLSAVTNAANEQLSRGTGICGQIFQAAEGQSTVLSDYIAVNHKHGCPAGQAISTPSFRLLDTHGIKNIIHAVAPNYGQLKRVRKGKERAARELDAVYTALLIEANRIGATSLTVPCLGTGIFKYPLHEATEIALCSIRRFLDIHSANKTGSVRYVVLALWKDEDIAAYKELLPVYFPLR